MTLALMEQFGVSVTRLSGNVYEIPNSGYTNPERFEVEADASSASYPLAMAAISGGAITVESVGTASLQGDAGFCRVLEAMGCNVDQGEDYTAVTAPASGQLQAVDVDMGDITDTFMTAAVLMATCPAGSVSRITNIANQRVKECNRIEAMVTELGKCGVSCSELPDGIQIIGAGRETPETLQREMAHIHCYKDHRIAMSFGVLGCLWHGIHITDKDCTDKTYPAFWDDLSRLHSKPGTVRAVLPNGEDGAGRRKPRRETLVSRER
jgi:pentafunctional AROM polypeptide